VGPTCQLGAKRGKGVGGAHGPAGPDEEGGSPGRSGPTGIRRENLFGIKIGFFNLPTLWKFIQGDLGGILMWGVGGGVSKILQGSSRIFRKCNMPCHECKLKPN
jgi:hypothetical protein